MTAQLASYALYHGDCVLAFSQARPITRSAYPCRAGVQRPVFLQPGRADFGNCDGDDDFAQCDYLLPELLRVTIPAVRAIVHRKDRIIYHKWCAPHRAVQRLQTTAISRHGWLFYGRITIATADPVRETTRRITCRTAVSEEGRHRHGVGCSSIRCCSGDRINAE